jgi:hypothetical protein
VRKQPRPQFLLLAALLAAAPAGADWLVTRDGGRIESKGPWKVQGRQVLFTQPNGTLASIRTDQVDLDRSALETQRAREAAVAPPVPAPKPEPVFRLTDKDLPAAKEAEDETAPAAAKAGTQVSSGLVVEHWEKAETSAGDGVEIFGTVKNSGTANVTSPTLMVTLYDAEGRLIATAEGKVNAAALPPSQTASFRAVFPGVDDFSAARFDPQGTPFATRAEGAEGETTEAAPDEGSAADAYGPPVVDEPLAPEDNGSGSGAPAEPPPSD